MNRHTRRGAVATAVLIAVVFGLTTWTTSAHGQMVRVGVPFQSYGDSFYENIGMTWGFTGPNFFFNGPGMAPPPFGNHDPNSDARFGYGTSGNGGAFNFNFVAGQGSNRTNTATIPSVVVYNGQNASVSDTSQRPFVTGIIPVVNDRRVMLENLQRAKAEYSAKQALLDVEQQREDQLAKDQERARLSASDERKRTIDAPLILSDDVQTPPPVKSTRAEEVRRLVGKAEQLERDGKTTAAVIYYREAARKATGAQLGRLRAKIRQLGK